ncbi:MAG: DUF1049 domain-containing protein [Actinobacteria bacterium]|nr:DUF1049 domain-containing protein [Actinomycetota bacterium]
MSSGQGYGPDPYQTPPPEPYGPPGGGATPPAAEGLDAKGRVKKTRSSDWLVGLIVAALLLIALCIFIGQNSADVSVHFLGAHGRVSLAIALLLSAVAGILLVAIPGVIRIVQLRRALRRNASPR